MRLTINTFNVKVELLNRLPRLQLSKFIYNNKLFMSKTRLSSVLFIITILILIIILIPIAKDPFGFIFIILLLLPSYFFAASLLKSNYILKTMSEKSLINAYYFIFTVLMILFIPFLIRNFFPHSISFLASYNGDLYSFIKHNSFSYFSIPFFRPFIETIELFFAADIFFISICIGIILAIYLRNIELENKKGELKK